MHRAAMTQTRLINQLTAGRGQGFGKDFKPFLQVTRQDHASIGQSHIVPNQFLGREHHLVSTLERQTCVSNLALPCVTDLREQYPTWPQAHSSPLFALYEHQKLDWNLDLPANSEGTVAIAKRLGIRHFKYIGLGTPYVYTTDQLVTITLPGRAPFLVALCVKYRSELSPKKTRRKKFLKLRREREYWRVLGIPWLLVTERSIHEQVHENLEWCLSGVVQRLQPEDIHLLDRLALAIGVVDWGGRTIDQMQIIAKALCINTSTAVRLLKVAIWRALIPVDLTQKVDLQRPLPILPEKRPPIPLWSPLRHIGDRK